MAEITKIDYKRAEKFLAWNTLFLISNSMIKPNWIDNSDRFWFIREQSNSFKFVVFSPTTKEIEDAFDHDKVANSLSAVFGRKISANYLPFRSINITEKRHKFTFSSIGKNWECDLNTYQIKELDEEFKAYPNELLSPNNKWALFHKENNLFLRSIKDNVVRALTSDGVKHNEYAVSPECNTHEILDRRLKHPKKPIALWSPDSKKVITFKIDQRNVKDLHLIQAVPQDNTNRPILYSYKYPFPGDKEIPMGKLVAFNVETNKIFFADHEPFPITYWNIIEYNWVWWDRASENVFFVFVERYHKSAKLYKMNIESGNLEIIYEESANSFIEIRLDRESGKFPNIRIINKGKEVIWWSQRDGWAHLYLYELREGKLINQITSGNWVVRDILHVDERERYVYFTAGGKEEGRDPYYRHLYRIKLDGTGLQLLTHENADHDVIFSPSGSYFFDRYSRVDLPAISIIRDMEGKLIKKLGEVNISKLLDLRWKYPKPFRVTSDDGFTDIYGLMYFPSSFDPNVKYPIIDFIYHGPQRINTLKIFPLIDNPQLLLNFWTPQSLAELGFIVLTIDGRGTPYRSKTFHDFCYGDVNHTAGLKDHVAAIRQLSEINDFLDLNRIGIFGHSSGGLTSVRAMLEYPKFYKVAVSSAGNHNSAIYLADWIEKYLGKLPLEDYSKQANYKIAKKLEGKLLIVHGELDDNVHPSNMMVFIDALIKANKDFDMLLLPNRDHLFLIDPYFIRKRWDYFVKHLLGREPPKNYKIRGIDVRTIHKLISN